MSSIRFLFCLVLLFCESLALAQQPPKIVKRDGTSDPPAQDSGPFSHAPEPFRRERSRMLIELESEKFQKMMSSALRVKSLADEFSKTAESANATKLPTPNPLHEIEKLVKDVLDKAGGLKSAQPDAELPKDFTPACRLLADYADNLAQYAKKSSRFVMSAGVVKYSNNLLTLLKYMEKSFQ